MSETRHLNERIETVLHLVGLKGREKDRVKTYSHGMKQRLGLAQALLHDPELIILDEPSTGLDPQGIIELRNLILHLKNDLGKTVILSSHILSEIEMIADSMVIIHRGKAVVQGKVSELLSHENLQVDVQVDEPAAAETALTESRLGGLILERLPGALKLQCAKGDIPHVARLLTDKGIAIFGIQATRSLEDYFLRITASPEKADIMAFK
ncbi:MAG: ABC transporter ATP-binding protein [Haliscomenobacter sp.]|nr:ABC transporter ATP-binding protein [Haliscomenobacter sp.]